MSIEGEYDLDALIQNDKRQAKIKKIRQIQKKRTDYEEKRKIYQQQRRRKIKQKHQNDQSNIKKEFGQQKTKYMQREPLNSTIYYAISITGLLSDVSIDDICKLLGERKIVSIRTQLRNKDRSPINTSNASLMEVVVILADKGQADSFVKSYSEKKLDGKYQLAFSFVNPNQQLR